MRNSSFNYITRHTGTNLHFSQDLTRELWERIQLGSFAGKGEAEKEAAV